MIDLCPVGALTSKPYAFTARPWELKHTESIDVSDALGAAIRVDSRGPEVMRIVPRQNDEVNEDWLSDKGRFQYDGLRRQRLGMPMVKGTDGKLHPVSWLEALEAIAEAMKGLKGYEMKALAGMLQTPTALSCYRASIFILLMHFLSCKACAHDYLMFEWCCPVEQKNPNVLLYNV